MKDWFEKPQSPHNFFMFLLFYTDHI